MYYQSKKINKKYLKKQSRKPKHKMYGGDDTTIVSNPTFNDNVNKMKNLSINVANNLLDKTITAIGDKIGIEPNQSVSQNTANITNNFRKLKAVISDPKFKEEAQSIIKEAVQTVKPGLHDVANIVNELVEKEIPIIGNMANEAILMIPAVGQAVGAAEEVGNVVQAGEAAVESVAKLTTVGAQTVENAKSLWAKGNDLYNTVWDKINTGASTIIDSATDKFVNVNVNENEKGNQTEITAQAAGSGGSLKHYNKQAKMIGGRIRQSQLEFLSSSIKNLQKHNRTKRNKLYRH